MIDVNQIGLMRTKKGISAQLFLNFRYALRNNNGFVIGEIKCGGTIVALAVQDILFLDQMDGIQGVERNSLRSLHFPFFYKRNR